MNANITIILKTVTKQHIFTKKGSVVSFRGTKLPRAHFRPSFLFDLPSMGNGNHSLDPILPSSATDFLVTNAVILITAVVTSRLDALNSKAAASQGDHLSPG